MGMSALPHAGSNVAISFIAHAGKVENVVTNVQVDTSVLSMPQSART